MRSRKTFKVNDLRNKVNRMLALPLDRVSTLEKQALCYLWEEVSMEADNYHGFSFINMTHGRAVEVSHKDEDYYNRYYIGAFGTNSPSAKTS